MNAHTLTPITQILEQRFDQDILPLLMEYIKIPAKSPGFDSAWDQHGHLATVIQNAKEWAETLHIKGLTIEIIQIGSETPCIFFDIPATGPVVDDRTILFYGHLDKQPEMAGWSEGLGPWIPKVIDQKLYGRGSADDGYAVYSALSAIATLDAQGVPRVRCVGLIETAEESGSYNLPIYLQHLAPRMGNVDLVIGLDSGCGNYEQLWMTTSLRGLAAGVLSVEILEQGVHSGNASGIVASSFRIARHLISRIEDSATGTILLPELHAEIPESRQIQAQAAGEIMGEQVWKQFPWVGCSHGTAGHVFAQPVSKDPTEAILNRTWRPALAVTGSAGFPTIDSAGNVLRPFTKLKLSMRIPPTIDAEHATWMMKKALEANPPYQAKVSFTPEHSATGWNAPETAPWLQKIVEQTSQTVFQKPVAWMGEGGTIPFMNMLGDAFPKAQYVITGVLGPQSNAHGPDEFLHLPYVKKLTTAVAAIVMQHYGRDE